MPQVVVRCHLLVLPRGPGSSVGCTASPPGASGQRTAPLGVIRLLSTTSPRAQSCPSGEIIPGILQMWNCSPLSACFSWPAQHWFIGWGPSGCFSGQERGLPLSSVEASQQWGKAAFAWVHASLQARAPRPEDLTPLLPQNSSASFFPVSCTWECGLSPRVPAPVPSRCLTLLALPLPLHKTVVRSLALEPDHLGSRPSSTTLAVPGKCLNTVPQK